MSTASLGEGQVQGGGQGPQHVAAAGGGAWGGGGRQHIANRIEEPNI